MSDGFRGGFVSATGELRIPQLQSPDFLAGVKGWRIGADGSATFGPLSAGDFSGRGSLASLNYVEGVSGWQVDREGQAQVENINVLGTVGAMAVTANDIRTSRALYMAAPVSAPALVVPTGREDINVSDALWTTPRAAVGRYDRTTDFVYGAAVTAETGVSEVWWDHYPGRAYLIVVSFNYIQSVATDKFTASLRITGNNTQPTTTAPWIFAHPLVTGTVTFNRATIVAPYVADPTAGKFRVGLFIRRDNAGTGSLTIPMTNLRDRMQMVAYDMGMARATGDGQNYGTNATPTTGSNVTYPAVWAQSYDGNSPFGQRGTTSLYQGFFSTDWRNQRSLIGFDSTKIMADLTGATISEGYVNVKVQHAGSSSGLDLELGTHTYTAKPAEWAAVNVSARRFFKADIPAGSSARIPVPLTILNEFKSGAARGIAIGPTLDTAQAYERYGYLYGVTSASLEISSSK